MDLRGLAPTDALCRRVGSPAQPAHARIRAPVRSGACSRPVGMRPAGPRPPGDLSAHSARSRPQADRRREVEVSALIVSWNTRDLLRACLGSLELELATQPHEVIVVDNASSDGSAEMV